MPEQAAAGIDPQVPPGATRGDDSSTVGGVDGTYLLLGPSLASVREEQQWEVLAGGQLTLLRIAERATLAAVGVAVGVARPAVADRPRLWSEVIVGARPAGVLAGLAGGGGVEFSPVQQPRWRAHLGVWIFAGAVPYARVGVLQGGGVFAEVGVQIDLPIWRW